MHDSKLAAPWLHSTLSAHLLWQVRSHPVQFVEFAQPAHAIELPQDQEKLLSKQRCVLVLTRDTSRAPLRTMRDMLM